MLKSLLKTSSTLVLVSALLTPAIVEAQGILLLAHGGNDEWNREVLSIADRINPVWPVEVAFGMANKRTIQDALDRLARRDVSSIVAVPLFVSSHSSVLRATEYLLGSRDDAPPELELFARMSARSDAGGTATDTGFDRTTPIDTTVPISVTTALDGHALVGEILISRAVAVSRTPEDEIVVVVAHGPRTEEDNTRWLDNEEKSVLIVPLLLSYGGIEAGIRQRLEGHTLAISCMTVGELSEGAYRGERGAIRCERRTRTIAVDDAWSAATAWTHGLPLVTHNPEDFRNIMGLDVLRVS